MSEDNWSFDTDLEILNSPNIEMPEPLDSSDSLDTMNTWCDSTELYLIGLRDRSDVEAKGHMKNKQYYSVIKHTIGIPSVLIGAIMASLEQQTSSTLHRVAFLVNSLICSFQYYFNFSRKEIQHNAAYDLYTEFVNEVDSILSIPVEKRKKSCKETIDRLSKRFVEIQTISI